MGAWGVGTFENDDALDWLLDLIEIDDTATVRAGLAQALDSDCCDARDGASALAAAEMILSLLGDPTPALARREEFAAWRSRHRGAVDVALAAAAIGAIDRSTGVGSELPELWEDSNHAEEWRASVQALRAELTARLATAE